MSGNMIGRTFNGRYRITERIGIGGMAEVYRAQDNVLGRLVAVKVMLPQYAADPDFTHRFRQEASSAANLQSPYIVNVYDWGQDDGTYYIVMEYVRGSDLKTAINERGAIDQRKAAQIGSQVCQALSVAHHLDIIHRDIKPQNIMVQPDGNVKVMDFGIARAKNSMKSQTSSVLGTAHYISPEQAQGKELTPASDIYSLGIVMYEAVTGHLPFDGPDAVSVAMKQVNEMPPAPSEYLPTIDPGLENIILKAMEKDPSKRFSTALEMRSVLNDFLAGRLNNAFASAPTSQMNSAYTPAAGSTSVMPAVGAAEAASSDAKNYRESSSQKKKMNKKKKILIAVLAIVLAAVGIGVAVAVVSGASNKVPDVTGKTLSEAKTTLSDSGYSIGTTTEVYSADVASGKVVSTDPAAGATADKGTRVNISVSKGVEQVSVPNLSGMSAEDAKKALTKLGLTPKEGTAEHSSSVDEGLVISQSPGSDSIVSKGTEVTYVLSLGPETVTVPSVVGQSQGTATSNLSAAGFTVTSSSQYSSTVAQGVVISQSPYGNTSAEKGATVNIIVSLGPQSSSTSSGSGSSSSGSGSSSSSTTTS